MTSPAGEFAIVFGGGNALAAYNAGAFEAVSRYGLEPSHVAGSSAGAVTAVLVAGNASEHRVTALKAFWHEVALPEPWSSWQPTGALAQALQLTEGVQARLFGRFGMFRSRPLTVFDPTARPGLYDLSPLRDTLAKLVDMERLNRGDMRVSLLAVDLETGQETVFDNRAGDLTLDHVLASASMPPNFPPAQIGERWYGDGGLAANLPAHLVLDPPRDGLTCLLIDPYPLVASLPATVMDAQQRQEDLLFASQSRRSLEGLQRIWSLEARLTPDQPLRGTALRVEYRSEGRETPLKTFGFGRSALRERWTCGLQDTHATLQAWDRRIPEHPGLHIHAPPGQGYMGPTAREPSIPA